jgi:myosin-1
MNSTTAVIGPIVGFAYSDEHGVPDAVLLNDATEEAFLANLRSRYMASKMFVRRVLGSWVPGGGARASLILALLRVRLLPCSYTYIGEVLIACNPYQDVGLRDPAEAMLRFEGKALYQAEPHVFALAQTAYSTLRRTHRDTVVIISGRMVPTTEASRPRLPWHKEAAGHEKQAWAMVVAR